MVEKFIGRNISFEFSKVSSSIFFQNFGWSGGSVCITALSIIIPNLFQNWEQMERKIFKFSGLPRNSFGEVKWVGLNGAPWSRSCSGGGSSTDAGRFKKVKKIVLVKGTYFKIQIIHISRASRRKIWEKNFFTKNMSFNGLGVRRAEPPISKKIIDFYGKIYWKTDYTEFRNYEFYVEFFRGEFPLFSYHFLIFPKLRLSFVS